MKNVLHFVRKNTQFRASFINNQIVNHVDFKPHCVFIEKRSNSFDGGFAEFDLKNVNYLYVSENSSFSERFRAKYFKTLSKNRISKISDFIKINNIDVCHFHFGTDCGAYAPLLKYLDVPSIVSFYGYDCSSFPKLYFGYGKRYLRNRVFKHISTVLAMSQDMKNDLIKAGCPEHKIVVHYYGTDTDRFYHTKKYEQNDCIKLLILANLVPKKGHLFLLKSIKQLQDSGINNFQLRIVGAGELDIELKAFVIDNNLNSNVIFTGAIPYNSKEMHEEYRNGDIFIHPSVIAPDGDKEGIPGTIVEAMSAGLPVISTNHAGIPQIIEHTKTGWLVNEYDQAALSESIKKLMFNRALREEIGLAGQEFAMKHLNLMVKETELELIYRQNMKK